MEEGMWNEKGKWKEVKDKKVREKGRGKFETRAAKAAGHRSVHKCGVSGPPDAAQRQG